jgi:hypothetical protein
MRIILLFTIMLWAGDLLAVEIIYYNGIKACRRPGIDPVNVYSPAWCEEPPPPAPVTPPATVTCTNIDANQLKGDYNLIPVNLTLNGNLADFSLLYTYNSSWARLSRSNCSNGSGLYTHITLADIPAGTTYTHNGITIYPTSVRGIGMSFMAMDVYKNVPVPAYPQTTRQHNQYNDVGDWVTIKLWKTPGNLAANNGSLALIGPRLVMGIQLPAGRSFSTSTMGLWSPTFWPQTSRRIVATATFQSGTCQLNTRSAVQLGEHNAHSDASEWKDASFSLNCPAAYGYGGSVSNASAKYAAPYYSANANNGARAPNTAFNNTLKISVLPRTAVVTQNHAAKPLTGTFATDSGGATGYGIQLAWGEPTAQSAGAPTKPVVFNSPIPASQINSAYTNGPYPLGKAMPSPLIKMAARLIRTTGAVQAGLVTGAVEILAEYN